ncbi:MAG: SEC-C domain-containing protein [Candidatus Lindowbacteria bacterium]|nr:SEC-C domain-containing protein [Candidatus Lindowbacteria bacterium]
MRIFGGERVSKMMDAMAWDDGEPIVHPWVSKAIARAQDRVEIQNFEIRKRLLDYDNVMNQQREVIYEIRDMALDKDENIESYYAETAEELLDIALDEDAPENKPNSAWDIEHLSEFLKRQYDIHLPADVLGGQGMNRLALREMLDSEIKGRFEARKEEFGKSEYLDLARQIILMQVDSKWKDHLQFMDTLRQGIGWRGMGGSDPLVEYKHEGFGMFMTLIQAQKEDFVSLVNHVQPVHDTAPRVKKDIDVEFSINDSDPSKKGRKGKKGKKNDSDDSSGLKKIGRNDPCSCGSGRKYKKCCGV